MRAPLKCLAPLILLPFLACDGSPLEPDTDQAATELVQPAEPMFGTGSPCFGCGVVQDPGHGFGSPGGVNVDPGEGNGSPEYQGGNKATAEGGDVGGCGSGVVVECGQGETEIKGNGPNGAGQ